MEITLEEFDEALRSFRRSAFRLEVQPTYLQPYEQEMLARWRSGEFQQPDEVPEINAWYAQVAGQVASGRTIARVRIQREPKTEYQAFEEWGDSYNVRAGERINYLSESRAYEVGLYPEAADRDWWLLDDERLLTFTHEGDGSPIRFELVTDPELVTQAKRWRDLALSASTPSNAQGSAA